MGSDFGTEFYTLDQAKNRLQRSKRSIHYYVRDGRLRKEIRDGEILLRKEDVEQLAIELGSDAPAVNRRSMLQMSARIQQLEMTMAIVRRRLDITPPLRPTSEEASTLYRAASHALSLGQWSTKDARTWANVFEALDEVALEAVGDATGIRKPWKVFYELCLAMMKRFAGQPEFAYSLELQTTHQLLDESRKRMRTVIVTWTELGRGDLSTEALSGLDSGVEDLMKRLGGKKP